MKIKHAFVFFAGLLIAGVASAVEQSQFNGKDFTRNDAEWIAVLESDADVAAKRAACRELAVTGTAAAVPPLAELLRDAKLSHMARFALEHIPGAAADAALIDALDDSEGEALAALIASIGVRRIDAADTALLEFLKHSDPAVVKAAANALGRLATDRSIQGLRSTWEKAGSDQHSLLIAGLLTGAERLQEAGGNEAANALYLQVWETAAETEPMRNGALTGAIQTGGAQGQQRLLDCLRGEDAAQAQLALRTALSVNTAETAETLIVALSEVQPERQVLLIGFLADMGRVEQVPTLFEYAEAGDSAVRVAAIRALGRLGSAGTAELYLKLMQDTDTQVALAASEGLTGLATDDADSVIVAGLKDADAAFTVQLLGMIAQRRLKSELPALQALLDSADAQVRLAAIESYGELAEVEQLPILLTAIETRTDAADIQALGKAIAQVCILADAPEVCLPLLKSSEAVAVPEAKSMLGKVIQRIERAS